MAIFEKARDKVYWFASGAPSSERNEYNLVARRVCTVPASVLADKRAFAKLSTQAAITREIDAQSRDM